MERPSVIKPVCYRFCNGLQDVMQCKQVSYSARFIVATEELLDWDTIVCEPESNDSEATTKDIDRKLVIC